MSRIATCLWFHNNGHEAAVFYTSLFKNSHIVSEFRHRDGPPLITEFVLEGTPYQALNGGPGYSLNPSASIVVAAVDQTEVDTLWEALSADGGVPGRAGWITDRFGMSWQILPQRWIEISKSADKTGMRRAFHALMDMGKISIDRLEAAFYNQR